MSMPQSHRVDSRAVPSSRTGRVKLTTRSNGSAQSRTWISLSSGAPISGRPTVRSCGSGRRIDLAGCASPGDGGVVKPIDGRVGLRAGRPDRQGRESCRGILSAASYRLNFANRRMPTESLDAQAPDISSGWAARKTSLPPSASSSLASRIHSPQLFSFPLDRFHNDGRVNSEVSD
jgi:hypothetical protein